MPYQESDEWYFGDYLGRLPGKSYSLLLYFIILLLFIEIALETEPTLDTKSGKANSGNSMGMGPRGPALWQ